MRRDVDPVAGAERQQFAVGETQPRRAGENQHEFRPVLVVPETLGARLPVRHDALDAHRPVAGQPLDDFAGGGDREVAQQVHALLAAKVAATARFHPA